MRSADKIYIMRSLAFEFFVFLGKPVSSDRFALSPVRNFIILAVHAVERASAEKHCAAAVRTAYARFLPHMGGAPCNFCQSAASAETAAAACTAFGFAVSGTQTALHTSNLPN